MSPQQIELLQASYAKVAPISAAAAGVFYGGCSSSIRPCGRA